MAAWGAKLWVLPSELQRRCDQRVLGLGGAIWGPRGLALPVYAMVFGVVQSAQAHAHVLVPEANAANHTISILGISWNCTAVTKGTGRQRDQSRSTVLSRMNLHSVLHGRL